MKILSQIPVLLTKETATTRSPIKVCMHVLGLARTDARVMRQAAALVEAGFAVSIVDVVSTYALPAEEEIRGIHVKHIYMPSWSHSTHFKPWFLVKATRLIIRSAIELMRQPVDVYHAHEEEALPACYIAARVHRKLLVFDAHELPFDSPNVKRWHRLRAISTKLLAYLVQYCAGVIAVSPPIAQELRSHYPGPEVTLLRNVPWYQAVERSDRLRRRLDLGSHVQIALYQGNLQPDRELDRLIRAAAFLKQDIVMVLMGRSAGETQAQLEALIASEGVADRVKILPPVPYQELLDWTASADIGLIIYSPDHSLNVQLCLPNKLFEYLMAGLPVLASPLKAVSEVLSTYDVGKIVHPLSPTSIAATINAMLADREELARMHCNALQAAQQLCWENEQQQLIRLYRDILAK